MVEHESGTAREVTRRRPWQAAWLMLGLCGVAAANSPDVVTLWPQGAPGAPHPAPPETLRITDQGERVVSNVHAPSITVYLPTRSRSAQWHVDPDPIDRLSSRPAFDALIYPAIPHDLRISKKTPPTFLLAGSNDAPAISQGVASLYASLRQAGVPAELHLYDGVERGFGMRFSNAGPVAEWPHPLLEWLAVRGS